VHWSNVVLFALIIFALIAMVKMREEIAAFFSCMAEIGPGHTTEEKMWGLMVYLLIAGTFLATLRIIIDGARRSPPPEDDDDVHQ
jgi:hypothetical protein